MVVWMYSCGWPQVGVRAASPHAMQSAPLCHDSTHLAQPCPALLQLHPPHSAQLPVILEGPGLPGTLLGRDSWDRPDGFEQEDAIVWSWDFRIPGTHILACELGQVSPCASVSLCTTQT